MTIKPQITLVDTEPVVGPRRRDTLTDAEAALSLVAGHLRAEGVWTATLRWHVDRWLDHMLWLRCDA